MRKSCSAGEKTTSGVTEVRSDFSACMAASFGFGKGSRRSDQRLDVEHGMGRGICGVLSRGDVVLQRCRGVARNGQPAQARAAADVIAGAVVGVVQLGLVGGLDFGV